jgi:hypothetical protein
VKIGYQPCRLISKVAVIYAAPTFHQEVVSPVDFTIVYINNGFILEM